MQSVTIMGNAVLMTKKQCPFELALLYSSLVKLIIKYQFKNFLREEIDDMQKMLWKEV